MARRHGNEGDTSQGANQQVTVWERKKVKISERCECIKEKERKIKRRKRKAETEK